MVVADAHRRRGVASSGELAPMSNRAVIEYLAVLDDAAFGGATPVARSSSHPPIRRPAGPPPVAGPLSTPMPTTI